MSKSDWFISYSYRLARDTALQKSIKAFCENCVELTIKALYSSLLFINYVLYILYSSRNYMNICAHFFSCRKPVLNISPAQHWPLPTSHVSFAKMFSKDSWNIKKEE